MTNLIEPTEATELHWPSCNSRTHQVAWRGDDWLQDKQTKTLKIHSNLLDTWQTVPAYKCEILQHTIRDLKPNEMKESKWIPTCEKLLHVQCFSLVNVEPDHLVCVCFLSNDGQTLNFTQKLHHSSVFLHCCVSPGCSGWLQEKLNSENKSRTSDSPHEVRKLKLCWWTSRETHSTRQDADSLNFDLSRDAQRVDSLQLQSVLILQHVTTVHRHLQDTSRKYLITSSAPF